MKNYYQILGIERNSSLPEIKKAYRKLATKFHPDKNGGDKFFEERFKEIQEAYEVLTTPLKKERYDNEYDVFFNKQKTHQTTSNKNQTENKQSKSYTEKENQRKEYDQKKKEEQAERERVNNLVRNAELEFEDKAWIFLGNWFIIPGAVGLYMFFKYRSKGFVKKSNQVCSLTLVSFVVLLVLAVIMVLAKEAGR